MSFGLCNKYEVFRLSWEPTSKLKGFPALPTVLMEMSTMIFTLAAPDKN